MKTIIVFFIFGFAFSIAFSLLNYIEKKVHKRIFSIIIDILFCISSFLVFFCLLIGYNNAQMRYYYLVISGVGFFALQFIFNKLFKK